MVKRQREEEEADAIMPLNKKIRVSALGVKRLRPDSPTISSAAKRMKISP
jgi:hypothetical protein